MQFSNISLSKFALIGVLTVVSNAHAGELFRNGQQIRSSSAAVTTRSVQKSTRAVNLLDHSRSTNYKQPGFSQSSPYEYRIAAYDKAVDKYQSDYAKWETRVQQIENRDKQKEERMRANEAQKAIKLKEKNARLAAKEEQRLARLKNRDDKGKAGSIFGRAFGSSSDTTTNVIQDEKAKKAESFFGNVEDSSPEPAAQPKLSFWQRLKKAMFGG